MVYRNLKEGLAEIKVPSGPIKKSLEVFYNPEMTLNRDVTVALFRALGRSKLKGCDLLAGSGIRSIRLLKEAKNTFQTLIINDANPSATANIRQNLKLNKIRIDGRNIRTKKGTHITQKDANELLALSAGYDYIDIDPFGSPNPYLDQSIQHLARDGILAITATDTAALSGTSPSACRRKYWAEPLRNYLQHEIGLRILARKCQLAGAQYEKALVPLLAYAEKHYMRIIFQCKKGKKQADEVLKDHSEFHYCKKCLLNAPKEIFEREHKNEECSKTSLQKAGPVYTGRLCDDKLLSKMQREAPSTESRKLIKTLQGEAKITQAGFYDIHQLASSLHTAPLKIDELIAIIRQKGFDAVRAHYTQTSIKSNISNEEIKQLISNRNLMNN